MATGAVLARILTQYSDKGSKAAQKDIAKLTKKFDDFGKKAAKSFKIAITATAALAVKIGTDAVQAAIDDSKSQVILANALKTTANANGQLTTEAEAYIEATMFRVNVADEQLRASLAQLIISTGDLTQAERLQAIALDVAGATGKDLSAVTVAMTKANEGNVDALKRLSPELSGLIYKGMKAEEAFVLLGAAYGGTAEALANLDPLTNLKLQYGEVLETLGYELLPVIQEFAEYIKTDVLPIIDEWAKSNGGSLRDGLTAVIELSLAFFKTIGDIASFLVRNKFWLELALNFFVLGKAFKFIGGGLKLIDKGVGGVIAIFKGGTKSLGKFKDKFDDFMKTADEGFFGKLLIGIGKVVSVISQLIQGFLGMGIAWISVKNIFGKFFGSQEKAIKTNDKLLQQQALAGFKAIEVATKEANAAKAKADALKKAQQAAKAASTQDNKDAAYKAKVDAKLLSIRKTLNLTKDSAIDKETDLINLTAAANFLAKQGVIAKEELAKLDRLKEENLLLSARDTLVKRYADIQEKLADQKLDTKEIEDLSKKWGISGAAVVAYIHLVKSVEDQVISTEEIKTLADLWNTSEYEAQKFLETYMRIQDGLLDSNEVFALIKAGFFETEREARTYADIVSTVHDGIANDEDFQKVMDKWDLTKEKLNQYILKMGADFDYEGNLLYPITQLAIKWDAASGALQRYLDKLNGIKSFDYNKLNPPGTPAGTPAGTPSGTPSGTPTIVNPNAASAAASAAAAAAYAAAKARGDMDAAAKAAAGVNPSALAANESGAIGAASIASQLRAAEAALATATAQGNTLTRFRAKEAEDLAASLAASSQLDADERAKFRSMTMANASSIAGDTSGNAKSLNVTVNVSGNVTTEQDLVTSIRNGLLNAQYNGDAITLVAI